jgi:SAM-dependent methyltransferase
VAVVAKDVDTKDREDEDLFGAMRDGATEPESGQAVEVVPEAEVEVETKEEMEARLKSLAEDEAIIESGLSTFRDTGYALMRIRDGKKYRNLAEQYKTFEDYCKRRWDMSLARGKQLLTAADVASALATNVAIPPKREAQVRELTPLRDDPDALQAAWAGAVELANGEQPTALQVREAVSNVREPEPTAGVGERGHPAAFSRPVLRVIRELLGGDAERYKRVLDPFAGTGRIHDLREYGFETMGIELEKEWADLSEYTKQGTALKTGLRKGSVDAIATSPTYGNRLADSYDASDPDRRHSYHFDLGRKPSEGSSAVMPWGDEYRAFHVKAWEEAVRVLKSNGRFILNIKDHIRDGEWQDVAAWHVSTIMALGFTMAAVRPVSTKGVPSGSNSEVRSEAELVFAFDRVSDAVD